MKGQAQLTQDITAFRERELHCGDVNKEARQVFKMIQTRKGAFKQGVERLSSTRPHSIHIQA